MVDDETRDVHKITTTTKNPNKLIFRYKFSETFIKNLYEFSKIHQYDDRNTFKEEWVSWVEENEDLVNDETDRLYRLGYDGDVLQKMFKSSRYYFRKKSTKKKAPVVRRDYISVTQELLDNIDSYISKSLTIKPAVSFIEFCKENTTILQKEVKHLYKKGLADSNEVKYKIKKTYKNRYFIQVNSSN